MFIISKYVTGLIYVVVVYIVGNSGPALGQAQTCGGVKPVKWNPNPPLLIILTESMVISKLDTLKPLMNVK
jgi:hypothetical protein